ncbi:hypothetical protein BDV06DRAFT_230893 [Aspergillus oleicola]
MLDIPGLTQRYEELSAYESSRNNFIEELLNHVKQLDAEVRKRDNTIDDKQRTIDSFREENGKYCAEISHLNLEQRKLSFVSVLVDGDGMNFQEQFVRGGKTGGQEAARDLRQAVDEHVRQIDPDVPASVSIRIRVYANVEGLGKAYRSAKIISDDQDLIPFIQGFNRSDELCDFVDVGSGKEGSDVKLRELFKQDVLDVHCHRILFCGSADNGYAHLLCPHLRLKRISLVEGPPFGRDIQELADDFDTVSFENIFMSSKLKPGRRVSFSNEDIAITPPATPNGNYAAVARATTLSPNTVAFPPRGSSISNRPRLSLCLNQDDQRVDRPLQFSSKEKVAALKRRKLCNEFQIHRECSFRSCSYTHDPNISAQEITDIMFIARSSPCDTGLTCRDVKCIFGHRCPQNNHCSHFYSGKCKFHARMHGVKTNDFETIEEYWIP